MTARKLIEEAREILSVTRILKSDSQTIESDLEEIHGKLDQALSLLPDADESASNWQEFDPKREEIWPKERGEYIISTPFYRKPVVDVWKGNFWENNLPTEAYQPLPPPYVKP